MTRTSSSALVAVLLAPLLLTGCGLLPDPRCAERAPEVSPATIRLAPVGWPPPPPGDTVCGGDLIGDAAGEFGMEVFVVVTDREFSEVLDHYEDALPEHLPATRVTLDDHMRLAGWVDGSIYAVESPGDGRYALVFQVIASR